MPKKQMVSAIGRVVPSKASANTALTAAAIFGGLLVLVALAYFRSGSNHVALFWAAFVLTRPLGAVVGDFLDKPVVHGGLELSRGWASAVLAGAIFVLIIALPQRAGKAH